MGPGVIISAVLEMLMRTYPENDPRARARRFFPIFAKIGYVIMATFVILGIVAIHRNTGSYATILAFIYGIFVLPIMGLGSWAISTRMYNATVKILRFKDRIFGIKPSKENA